MTLPLTGAHHVTATLIAGLLTILVGGLMLLVSRRSTNGAHFQR
jgi:LPXTG-motif cell wall-anchored protein